MPFGIGAVAAFVARAPHNDAGAVFVPLDHQLHAIHEGLGKIRVTGQAVIGDRGGCRRHVVDAVALRIRLAAQIEAVAVTHTGKQRRVGIVAGADGVDVVFLHDAQIAQHALFRYSRAQIRLAVVAVDAAELDVLSVKQNHLIADLHSPEAHRLHDDLACAAQQQGIELRFLRVPEDGLFQLHVDAALRFARRDFLTVGRYQRPGHHARLHPLNLYPQTGRSIVIRQVGMHKVIADAAFCAAQQIHIADDAGEAELVLILKVAAVAPLHDHHIQGVFAVHHRVGNVKLAGGVGHLTVTHKAAVHIDIVTGVHALKVEHALFSRLLPPGKNAPIEAAWIFMGNMRRVAGEGIARVRILAAVITVQLPHARHRHGIGIQCRIKNRFRHVDLAFKKAELPLTGKQRHALGIGTDIRKGFAFGFKGDKKRMRRAGIHMGSMRVTVIRKTHRKYPFPAMEHAGYFQYL